MSIVHLPFSQAKPNPKDELVEHLKTSQDISELDISRRITVIGLGGAGCNAIRTLEKQNFGDTVSLLAVNTDMEDLRKVKPEHRFLIGAKTTRGQGAGSNPEKGRAAMEESLPQLLARIGPTDMVVIIGGMGGGTGTGAAPVIAKALRDQGCLVVALVTMPQKADGMKRMLKANEGKARVEEAANVTITLLNENLLSALGEQVRLQEALQYADSVLCNAIANILNIMNVVGVDNQDYADVENALAGGGKTMISVGHAEGDGCEYLALERALYHPLVEPCNIRSATHGMVTIMGGSEEKNSLQIRTRVIERLNSELDSYCDFKGGYIEIPELTGIRVMVILSGMEPYSAENSSETRRNPMSHKLVRSDFKLVEGSHPEAAKPAAKPAAEPPRSKNAFSEQLDRVNSEARQATVSAEPLPNHRREPAPSPSKFKGPMSVISNMAKNKSSSAVAVEPIPVSYPPDQEVEDERLQEERLIVSDMEFPAIPIFLNKFSS